MDFHQLTGEAEKAVDQGRVLTARTLYEDGLARLPEHTLFFGYNLGALQQMVVGDGNCARAAYARGLAGRANSAGLLRPEGLDEFEANISENSMLLSLSFEEYEDWASRLEKLRPENPILIHQRPRIRDIREQGHAWWFAMLSIAKSGYDADAAKDPGRYAASASILQLLLLNRRQLRVPREEHRFAVMTYGTLTLQAWSKCGITMSETGRQVDPRELAVVLEHALPLVEEFAGANPADTEVQDVLGKMREALAATPEQLNVAAEPAPAVARSGRTHVRFSWGPLVFWTVLLAAAGRFLSETLGLPARWSVPAGALIGAVLGLLSGRRPRW